jgi:glutaminyl-peptide cyclotransferase
LQIVRLQRSKRSSRIFEMRRKTLYWFVLLFSIFLGILLIWGIWKWGGLTGSLENNESPGEFSGEFAYSLAKYQVDLGPRVPGSDSHQKTGDWIVNTLRKNNWEVEEQEGLSQGVKIRNIVGKIGEGKPWVVLGAHYDSRFEADKDPDLKMQTQPVPGANDGASGAAILLELSRVLSGQLDADGDSGFGKGTIWLVFFDWEDNGRIGDYDWIMGSRMFVETLETYPDAAIILDMVGDTDLNIFQERGSDPGLTDQIWDTAARLGFQEQFVPQSKYTILDDHVPFREAGIPAVDIIDFDYPYWHTVSDTMDKISPASLEIVGKTVLDWLKNYRSTK